MKATQKNIKDIGLIQKIAWSFHIRSGIEFDELVSEGLLAYYTGLKNYDYKRGAFTTFIWHHISNKLYTFCMNERKYSEGVIPIEEVELSYSHRTIFEYLSTDAGIIAEEVLSHSAEYAVCDFGEALKKIVFKLQKRGWSEKRIEKNVNELKVAFS